MILLLTWHRKCFAFWQFSTSNVTCKAVPFFPSILVSVWEIEKREDNIDSPWNLCPDLKLENFVYYYLRASVLRIFRVMDFFKCLVKATGPSRIVRILLASNIMNMIKEHHRSRKSSPEPWIKNCFVHVSGEPKELETKRPE